VGLHGACEEITVEGFLGYVRDRWRRVEVFSTVLYGRGCGGGIDRYSRASLVDSIKRWRGEAGVAVIAEYKRASPTGYINPWQDLREYYYQLNSLVAGFSVVVEREFFMGSPEYLEELRRLGYRGPILAKGFTFYRAQVDLYRCCGASAVLIIADVLDLHEIGDLYSYAVETGLEPLVEVGSFGVLEKVMEILPLKIVGINSRDLSTLRVDHAGMLDTIRRARKEYPDVVIVAESGINRVDDVIRAVEAGADACLVGTSLMRNPRRASMLSELYAAMNPQAMA